MSDDEDSTPPLPPIPDLPTAADKLEKYNRALTADWLRSIARLIENGAINGFDLMWDTRHAKPQGDVVASAHILYSPLESEVAAQLREREAQKQASKIQVQDVSEQLKSHEPCTNPGCLLCSGADKRS